MNLFVLARRAWFAARAAGLSRRAARERDEDGRRRARRALAELFREARGATLKVGQIWSSLGYDGDPETLVVHAEPRPLEDLRRPLEQALGRRVSEVFRCLDEPGLAASLGQVHRGELLDGRVVAVKIQYPEIARAVAAELALIGFVPAAGPVKRFGFDVGGYRRMLAATLESELDYRAEADRQERFRRAVAFPGLVVPEIVAELCRPTVLVSRWEEGVPLAVFAAEQKTDGALVGRALLLALFGGLFRVGEVHADPNGGNFLVRRDPNDRPEVVLLDFGCTLALSETQRRALLALVIASREATAVDPLACLVALGFDGAKLRPIAAALPALCQALFLPFAVDRPFGLEEWRLGERLEAALGELRWWFRSAAAPELVLLVRAFQGTAQHLERLEARLPWWPLLLHAVGEEEMARARAWSPPALPPELAAASPSLASLARYLRVAVTAGDEEIVAVTLPAAEIVRLAEHVPAEVASRLAEQGIEVPALVARVLGSGIAPQEVFASEQGGRRFRVWLE